MISGSRKVGRSAAWLCLLLPLACSPSLPDLRIWRGEFWGWGEERAAPDVSRGLEVVSGQSEVGNFHARVSSFYELLANRRFNSILTYRDDALRAYFRDDDEFADYYADLSHALELGHFERSRPLTLAVEEFALEEPGVATVTVLLTGENDLPLRYGETDFSRVDRWERHHGEWWLVPGKF